MQNINLNLGGKWQFITRGEGCMLASSAKTLSIIVCILLFSILSADLFKTIISISNIQLVPINFLHAMWVDL